MKSVIIFAIFIRLSARCKSWSTTLFKQDQRISISFTSEQEDSLKKRFDEGYDLRIDPEYNAWLKLNHLESLMDSSGSVVAEYFPPSSIGAIKTITLAPKHIPNTILVCSCHVWLPIHDYEYHKQYAAKQNLARGGPAQCT